MAICGRIKWALLSGFVSSALAGGDWVCVGKKREIREKSEDCGGGGRLRMDLPGIGMVTADDDGEQEEFEAAIWDRQQIIEPLISSVVSGDGAAVVTLCFSARSQAQQLLIIANTLLLAFLTELLQHSLLL